MKIKRIISLCMLSVMIIGTTINAHAFSNEDFLKYLINSNYPESKKKESNTNQSANKTQNTKSTDSEYIKLYIGNENQPQSNSSDKSTPVLKDGDVDSYYVTKKQPQILIYHTHSSETYNESPEGNYHSKNKNASVMEVGRVLTNELEKLGRGVVHNTKYHDNPQYNGSYERSIVTAREMMNKYKSVDIVIDLHRDASNLTSEEKIKVDRERYTTTINGETVAKFFFVIGSRSENSAKVKALAQDITNFAESMYPGITRPIVEKSYAKFNQYLSDDYMLVEVGSNVVTTKEAKTSAKYMAEILDAYYKQNGK